MSPTAKELAYLRLACTSTVVPLLLVDRLVRLLRWPIFLQHMCLFTVDDVSCNVNPFLFCRYEQQVGHLSSNVSRSAHTIGRLVNLIRVSPSVILRFPLSMNEIKSISQGRVKYLDIEFICVQDDDDFFELISTRYLVEGIYSTKLRAATARLLYSCVSCWMVMELLLCVEA